MAAGVGAEGPVMTAVHMGFSLSQLQRNAIIRPIFETDILPPDWRFCTVKLGTVGFFPQNIGKQLQD